MANPEHLERLTAGADAWNAWRQENPAVQPDLSNADLRRIDLVGAHLQNADMHSSDLSGETIADADLTGANLENANFERAVLSASLLNGARLKAANFRDANLRLVDLSGADLEGAVFRRASLDEVIFENANLTGAFFFGARFRYATFSNAVLRDANLFETRLANAHLDDAELIGANLRDTDLKGANLSRAVLRGADISGANLTNAVLVEADLRGAEAEGAVLNGANLQNARLERARLSSAHFKSADLSNAGLANATLDGAVLEKTVLTGANLRAAALENARIQDAHLYGTAMWGLRGSPAVEERLILTPADGPLVSVDGLPLAQFVYFLIHTPDAQNFIESASLKTALICGRFSEHSQLFLAAARAALQGRGLYPIMFDMRGPTIRALEGGFLNLARMSALTAVDMTGISTLPMSVSKAVEEGALIQPVVDKNRWAEWREMPELRSRFRNALPTRAYESSKPDASFLGDSLRRASVKTSIDATSADPKRAQAAPAGSPTDTA